MYRADLSGILSVVTGGSRGIGKHVADALHVAGAAIAITGRNKDTLAEAAADIGESCKPFVCDHRDSESIQAMAGAVQRELGAPDILVNNAGSMRAAPVLDMPLELWDDVIQTNLTGVFLTTKAFLPGMIEKGGGDIFIISSMSGKKGDPCGAAYSASKFGVQGFAQALFYEVRKHNIRVTVLNPSTVNTGPDTGPTKGAGVKLHAADIAATITHLACLPRRTLVRDMDIWATNPEPH